MRSIDPDLSTHLACGITTLCRAFRVTRTDGLRLGFTDHDQALTFDGTNFEPESGMDASEARAAFDFAAGGLDVQGAISSDGIAQADIDAGLFDGAKVEGFLVNWQAPSQRLRTFVAQMAEIKQEGDLFTATLNGPLVKLDREKGRIYAQDCDALLGDRRCSFDLNDPQFRAQSTVAERLGGTALTAAGLGAFSDAWFAFGKLVWTGGASSGREASVVSFVQVEAGNARIELVGPGAFSFSPGDPFTLYAGCDKRFTTCREKFNNATNFQGFPFMPGRDFLFTYGRRSG